MSPTRPRKLFSLVSLTLLGTFLSWAQDVPQISVKVKVVTMPVTVRDKHNAIVRNLTKDDFILEEDGKPQSIRYFTQETNLPLTLGLLVDTSLSERNVLDKERSASESFLDQMMTNANDKAFIIHFDREVELLQDLTSSKAKLQAALGSLQLPNNDRDTTSSDPSDGSGRHGMRGGGTLLYDAVFLASDELMKKQEGRKALIILSDGDDRGSKESLDAAIEAAQRGDTVIYSILFADDHHDQDNGGYGRQGGGGRRGSIGGGWPGGGGGYPGGGGRPSGGGQRPQQQPRTDGKKVLARLSEETGGRLYQVSKKETIDQIYTTIAEELRTLYTLGYTPDQSVGTGYHKLKLTTKQKDLTVQTRAGYYADR